jgi:hypothetical protein
MSNQNFQSRSSENADQGDADAVNLEGYVELGMAREALALAGAILRRRDLSPLHFEGAVSAVLLHAYRSKAWRYRIEKSFAAMSAVHKRQAGVTMLAYYGTIKDFGQAVRFVSRKVLLNSAHIYFAMEALLETGKMAHADRLARRCMRALGQEPGDEMLLEAMAEYFCHKGDLEGARAAWASIPLGGAFVQNALVGVVETHLADALLAADAGLEALENLAFSGDTEVIVPGNEARLIDDARKELRALRNAVARTLPVMRQKHLGIAQKPDPPDA